MPADMAALDAQRETLLVVLQRLADFGCKRAERRAALAAGQRDDDRVGDTLTPAGDA